MEDQDKTKEQLVNELVKLRQRIAELEKSEAERKQMEEALLRQAKEMTTLQETLLDIAGSHDLSTLLQTIVERATHLLKAMGGGLYLCDPDKEEVRCLVSYNTPQDYRGVVLKYGEGAAGIVAQTGEPLIIDDYRTWSKRAVAYEEEQPFTAVLSVPMIWKGRVIGVIHVLHNVESRRFTESDLDLLKLFANHAAIPVGNAQLFDQAQKEIAERKRAEEALRQAEENFRRSLDDSPLGVRIVTEGGETICANRAILQIYGYDSVEELRATRTKDRYTPESYAEFQKRLEKRRRGEDSPSEYEISIVRKSGEVRHLQAFRKEVLWNGERQFQTIYHDITERKRAEVALRRSEERFRASVENFLEGFAILSSIRDSDGQLIDFRYEYINQAGCKMNQKAREEHIGRTLLELFPEQKEIGLFDDCVEVIETGQPLAEEYVIYEPVYGGSDRLKQAFYVQISRLEDGIVVTWQDITEKKRREELLRQSEERLKRLVENSKDIIVMADLEGEVLYYNGPAEYGVRTEDVLGKNAFSIFEPVIAARLMNQLRQVVKEKEALTIESFISWRGESFWFLTHIYPIKDERDHMIAVGIIALDITERKRTEEVLRRSEASYRELADSIADVFFAFNKDLRYTYWNKASEELTGIPAKDAIGKFLFELFPDTIETRRAERVYLEVLRTKQPQSFVNEYQHGGKNYFFDISVYPSMSGLSAFVKDITERKQMEDVLQFTRFSLDHAADTMVCVDHEARFIDVNDAFCRSVGYSREQLLSMTVHDIDPDYTVEIWPEFWKKLKQSGSLTFESCHRTKEGKVFPVEIIANFFEYNGKEYHCSFARDITERKRVEEALRESEARYRIITDCVDDIIWQLDLGLHFVYVTPAVKRVLGYTAQEACGLYVVDLLDEDGLVRMREVIQNRSERKTNFGIPGEYRMRHKDGHWVDVEVLSSPLFDAEGHPTGFVGVTRDIGMRKRAEEALRVSEENFRAVVENAIDAILVGAEEGSHVYANQQAAEITGYCVAELLKTTIKDLVHSDEFEKIMQIYRRRLEGEPVPRLYETTIIRKDGKSVPIEVAGTKTVWQGKTADMVFFRDITERKQAEEALRESEGKYRDMVESISDVVYAIDGSGMLTYISPVVKNTLGYEPDELIGRQFLEFVHKEDHDLLIRRFSELREGIVRHSDYRVIGKHGDIKWVRTLTNPIIEEEGFAGARGVLIDITERKRAEEALQESEKRYRTAIEFSNDGVAIVREDFHLFVNQKFLEIFGYSYLEEIVGKPISIVIDPDDRDRVMENNRKRQMGKEVSSKYEFKGIRKDGSVVYVEVSATKTIYRGESVSLAYLRDITERKQAEQVLRESEESFRCLSEASFEGILIHEKGKIIDVNRTFATMFGYDLSEVVGRNALDFATPELREVALCHISNGSEDPYEGVAIRKDGSNFLVELQGKNIPYKGR